jgi:hypothetical protein
MHKQQIKDALEQYLSVMTLEKTLLSMFNLSPTSHIRRGIVHNQIADQLDLTLNHDFYNNLKILAKRLNIKRVTIQGKRYYKGIAPKT